MKKFFTLALAIAAGASMNAFGEAKYRLSRVIDEQYAINNVYQWNDQNQLVKLSTDVDDYVYYLFFYDEAGNINKVELYRDEDGLDNYRLNIVYRYEYNSDNQLVKREADNYVSFSDVPLPSMPMVWVYDTEGHIVQRITYRDQACTQIGQEVNYLYNDKGQLIQESDRTMDLETQSLQYSYRITFTYDENGNLVDKAYASYSQSAYVINKHDFYVWDENGDLTEWYTTSALTTAKVSQYLYSYDLDVPAEEVIYPWIPEENFVLETSIHSRVKHMVMNIDQKSRNDSGDMVLLYEWTYLYDELKNDAIETVAADNAEVAISLDGDMITFGNADVKSAKVYTIDGRLVLDAPALMAGKLPVSGLAKGAYVVTTAAGSAKFVK